MMTIGRRRGLRGATIAAVGVLAAGCTNAPGFQTLTIGEALASMLAFFIAFAAFWIFIWIFVDVFRRDDLSGVAKAGWVLALVILPLLGSLIYIGVRPKRPLTTSFSR